MIGGVTLPSSRCLSAILVSGVMLLCLAILVPSDCKAQEYLSKIGRPTYSAEVPVELGFVNAANGNLHIEIPLVSVRQRGGSVFSLRAIYDSHNWRLWYGAPGGLSPMWFSDNGGWRIVSSINGDGGNVEYTSTLTTCTPTPPTWYYVFSNFILRQADGTVRNFLGAQTNENCSIGPPNQPSTTHYALDQSGYYLSVTNYTNSVVYAPDGTKVTGYTDTNGNSGDGRTFYSETIDSGNPNIVYYDTTASDGTNAQFKVTYSDYDVNTNFQSGGGHREYVGTLRLVQQLQLPNGTSYSFDYDSGTTAGHYGTLTSLTLPTGGTVLYTYADFINGPANMWKERWVASRTSDGSQWTFQPQLVGTCSLAGHCVVKNTMTDPANRQTVYQMNTERYVTNVSIYPGSATGTPLRAALLEYNGVRLTRQTTTLEDGQKTKFEYDYWDSVSRTIKQVKDWNYYTGTAPATPTRQLDMTYLATTPYTSRNIINRLFTQAVSVSGSSPIAQTQLSYDDFPVASTFSSQATNHDYDHYGSTFNYRGNLTKVKRWLNPGNTWLTTENHYDDLGNLIYRLDPALHRTDFDFTDVYANSSCTPAGTKTFAYATTITDTLGHHNKKNYYPCTGQVQSERDENDIVATRAGTTYTYDLMGRRLVANFPDGGQTSVSYDDANPVTIVESRLVRSSPALSITTTSVQDALGRLAQTRRSDPDCGSGETKTDYTYGYDAVTKTRIVTTSNPYCLTTESTYGVTTTRYDALERSVQAVMADGSVVNTAYSGNLTTVTDEASKQRKSQTDALGRLTTVWEDPATLNYETAYTYDLLDNLTSVTQKGGAASSSWRTRSFTYDSLSRLKCAANPEVTSGLPTVNPASCPSTDTGTYTTGTIGYTYDSDSNVLTKTAPAPNQTGTATAVTNYTYDTDHRLTQKSYTGGAATATVKYGYDGTALSGCGTTPPAPSPAEANPKHNRTAMCDGTGATSWSHDEMGRVLAQQQIVNGSAAVNKYVKYTYYKDGELNKLTYPAGRQVTYTPNAAGRPVSAVDTGNSINYVTGAVYAPQGALASVTFGGVINGAYTYNSRLQPKQTFFGTNTPGTMSGTSCPATVGNIMHRAYAFNEGTTDNGNIILLRNCNVTNRTQNFTYDNLNRIWQAYTTGSVWGNTFVIDAWGNLTNKNSYSTKPYIDMMNAAPATVKNQLNGFCHDSAGNLVLIGTCPTGTFTPLYTYDDENRLTSAVGFTYAYDGDGKRVKKCSNAGCTAGTLYWMGTGLDPLQESALGGTATEEYIFFGAKRVARRDVSGGAVHYYFTDHLGSTSLITNNIGTVPPQEESDYFPYGGEMALTAGDPNNFKFTGKERDGETGLDYFGARHYGSNNGRFLSPDEPLLDQQPWDPQSWNLYSYVRNSALRNIDPNGRTCQRNNTDGTIYDDGDGKGCAQIEKQDRADRGDPTKASATVDGCAGEGAADCLAFMVSDRTTLANTTEVVRNGVEGAMTAEAIWNLPSLVRGSVSWLKALRTTEAEWKFGTFKGAQKWASQMAKRGWTEKQITEAIESGQQFPAPNNVNPANTATRYVHPTTGRSVVVDDVTKEVLHIGADGYKY